jgi:outer membrane protein TolC
MRPPLSTLDRNGRRGRASAARRLLVLAALAGLSLTTPPTDLAGAQEPGGREARLRETGLQEPGPGEPPVPEAGPAPAGAGGIPPGEEAPAPAQAPPYDLTLREAIERALRGNLDIAVRRLSPEIAGARVGIEEAAFDSSLNFQVVSERFNDPAGSLLSGAPPGEGVLENERSFAEASFVDPLPTGGRYRFVLRSLRDESTNQFLTVNPAYQSEWFIDYTQPLLRNFGRDAALARLEVARNNHRISESDFRQTVLDVIAGVEKAYWDLAFRILDLEVKKQSLELAQDLLRLNRTKVQVGTLAPIEITQAEAGVADREEAVIVAQNEIRNAEDRLKRLLGPPEDPIWGVALRPVEEPPFDETLPDLERSLELALRHRPDLDRARRNLASREAELGLARSQRLPGLDFQASYGARGLAGDCTLDPILDPPCLTPDASPYTADDPLELSDSLSQARSRDADNWRAGFTLSVPLGNRDGRSRYLAARLAREQAGIEIRLLEQTATVEVRQAVRQIETDIKRVKAARVNSRLQREKLEAEQKKFENGISTSFNVLEFQEDLAQARSRENLALVDYNRSRVELERVIGTLSDSRGITLQP